MTRTQPTSEELAAAAQALAKLSPGYLPLDIFNQIARLSVMSVIEFVPLRWLNGHVEVLLLPRPADDTYWRGLVHTPGTVLRSSDTAGTYIDAYKRLLDDELTGTATTGIPYYVKTIFAPDARGMGHSQIFYIEVTGYPAAGAFYDVQHLPDNVVPAQRGMIRDAAAAFRAARNEAMPQIHKTPVIPGFTKA